ncbi:hypothetical protein DF186_24570, partial [Enterococcus hirae]
SRRLHRGHDVGRLGLGAEERRVLGHRWHGPETRQLLGPLELLGEHVETLVIVGDPLVDDHQLPGQPIQLQVDVGQLLG